MLKVVKVWMVTQYHRVIQGLIIRCLSSLKRAGVGGCGGIRCQHMQIDWIMESF